MSYELLAAQMTELRSRLEKLERREQPISAVTLPDGTVRRRSLQDKASDTLSLFDVIPKREHAAIKARASTYDATADFIAALSVSRHIEIPAGEYRISERLVPSTDQHIVGLDMGARLRWYGAPNTPMIDISATQNGYLGNLKILGQQLSTSGATATASVSGGVVTVITVTNPGSGFTSTPQVELVGGGGTGAIARAVVSGGSIIAIYVISEGTGYTSPPTVVISLGMYTGNGIKAYATFGWHMTDVIVAYFVDGVAFGTINGAAAGDNQLFNTSIRNCDRGLVSNSQSQQMIGGAIVDCRLGLTSNGDGGMRMIGTTWSGRLSDIQIHLVVNSGGYSFENIWCETAMIANVQLGNGLNAGPHGVEFISDCFFSAPGSLNGVKAVNFDLRDGSTNTTFAGRPRFNTAGRTPTEYAASTLVDPVVNISAGHRRVVWTAGYWSNSPSGQIVINDRSGTTIKFGDPATDPTDIPGVDVSKMNLIGGGRDAALTIQGRMRATGSGATATASVADGAVTGVTMLAGGTLYGAVVVGFSGGGGTGAVGSAVLDHLTGEILSVIVTNGGTGYATAPTVTFTPTGGSGIRFVVPDHTETGTIVPMAIEAGYAKGRVLFPNGAVFMSGFPSRFDTYILLGSVDVLPAAHVTYRGQIIRVPGDVGVADHVYICQKLADDTYAWVQLDN